MSSQISKIIQVDNARGMEQRFRFISAKNTFDGNAQKIAPFSKVSVGERRVYKLKFFDIIIPRSKERWGSHLHPLPSYVQKWHSYVPFLERQQHTQ